MALVEALLALTGWVVHPSLGYLAWLPLPLIIALTAGAVRSSARDGRDYAGQVVAALEIGILGGLLATALTWLVHAELAPDALLQARRAAEARVIAAGGDAQAVANAVGLGSPFGRAILRFVEIMVTAILCGLAFARRPR